MADASTDPTHAEASSEPKLATTETELATNPVHGEANKEETAPASVCIFTYETLVTAEIR
jgi:hypothetical protein